MRLVAKSKQAPCMLQSQALRTARAPETKSTLCCRLPRRRGAKQGPNRALELFSHKFRARCRRSRPKERIILKPSPVSVERTRTDQMVCQHSNTTSREPCEYCRGPGVRKIIRSDPFEELRRAVRGACDCSMHGACFDFATRRTPITPQIAALGPLYCVQINSA